MKKILVPTDFSQNAFMAAKFAAFLAADRDWQLVICHVYRPFYSGFQGELQNQQDSAFAQQIACRQMDDFVRRLQNIYTTVNMQGLCLVGMVEDVIVNEAKQINAVLIVMGTQGASGIKYALFGSTTYCVIRKATVPVLAVTKTIHRFAFSRVGFTTNFHAVEIAALYDFIKLMGTNIEVIPFHLYAVNRHTEEMKMKAWKSKASTMVTLLPLKFRLSRMRSYQSGIRNFIKKEKLDALAMTIIDKDFFTRMIGKDLVKAVAHQCSIPVLFIPEQ